MSATVVTSEELLPILQELAALKEQVSVLNEIHRNLQWVTVKQACGLLGGKCRHTVYRMMKDDELQYKQDGKEIHISRFSIIEYNKSKTIR